LQLDFSKLHKNDASVVYRITKFRITECSLVDNPANDMATIESMELAKRYSEEKQMSLIDNEARAILRKYGIMAKGYKDSNSTSAAWSNPATGTNSASRGDGDDTPGYQPELDLLAAFIREFKTVIVELGASNENTDLSPEEVIEQASRIAMQRVKQTNATDWSVGNGDDDESLNPNGSSATATSARRSAADAIEQLYRPSNGFELAKRILASNDLDVTLISKLADRNRVGVAGNSDALLRHEGGGELRKLEDARSGDVQLSKILTEMGDSQLEKRLSERNERGLRKLADVSIFDSAPRTQDFAGSYSRGCLAADDFVGNLTKRLSRGRVASTIDDLLH
jgi:hypothetical protein